MVSRPARACALHRPFLDLSDMNHQESAEQFLQQANLFKLGKLPTESRHPLTSDLADWAKSDLPRAINALVKVDQEALGKLKDKIPGLLKLKDSVQKVMNAGGRIFMCGCGATGRLSLSLEYLWRQQNPDSEQVFSLMAGGDVALVHSLEGFEDFPAFGARHLVQAGFKEGDLLIAITEGGETPYVIGAAEEAVKISTVKPWFLYCNPDEVLVDLVERSRRIIQNPKVEKLNLTVGPMALSGSTRMQASSVLQLAAGFALFPEISEKLFLESLEKTLQLQATNAPHFLKGFVEREAAIYQDSGYVLYELADYFITVFTDTTERAPTFSLTPFSNPKAKALLARPPSYSYIRIKQAKTAAQAWRLLLGREPRPLNWPDVDPRSGENYLNAFDFGESALSFRENLLQGKRQEQFFIRCEGEAFHWNLMDHELALNVSPDIHPLFRHILLKILLNCHSTLVMGRIGRFEKNVMTYVYPTNGKLVDRATRYVLAILEDEKIATRKKISYEDVVREIFLQFSKLKDFESVVLKTVAAYKQN